MWNGRMCSCAIFSDVWVEVWCGRLFLRGTSGDLFLVFFCKMSCHFCCLAEMFSFYHVSGFDERL